MTPLAVGMAALGVAVQLAAAAAAGPTGLLNASLYRVSPLTYPGVQNMDTGESSLCSQRSALCSPLTAHLFPLPISSCPSPLCPL